MRYLILTLIGLYYVHILGISAGLNGEEDTEREVLEYNWRTAVPDIRHLHAIQQSDFRISSRNQMNTFVDAEIFSKNLKT